MTSVEAGESQGFPCNPKVADGAIGRGWGYKKTEFH